MFANVGLSDSATARLIDQIEELQPDLIGLAEVDQRWMEGLHSLGEAYPHRVALPRDDNFGIALLSRIPLASQAIEFVGSLGLPTIFAGLRTESGPWNVVVTHPIPPLTRFAFEGRNDQLARLADVLPADSMRTVVLGDLNGTTWSPYIREFRDRASLSTSARGLRSLYTWPAGLPILALGLDHCLHSESVESVGYEVLRSVGSDHFPIVCRFEARGLLDAYQPRDAPLSRPRRDAYRERRVATVFPRWAHEWLTQTRNRPVFRDSSGN